MPPLKYIKLPSHPIPASLTSNNNLSPILKFSALKFFWTCVALKLVDDDDDDDDPSAACG